VDLRAVEHSSLRLCFFERQVPQRKSDKLAARLVSDAPYSERYGELKVETVNRNLTTAAGMMGASFSWRGDSSHSSAILDERPPKRAESRTVVPRPITEAARVRSRARATSRLDPVVVELLSNIGRRCGEK
jgi:hypothetical protein